MALVRTLQQVNEVKAKQEQAVALLRARAEDVRRRGPMDKNDNPYFNSSTVLDYQRLAAAVVVARCCPHEPGEVRRINHTNSQASYSWMELVKITGHSLTERAGGGITYCVRLVIARTVGPQGCGLVPDYIRRYAKPNLLHAMALETCLAAWDIDRVDGHFARAMVRLDVGNNLADERWLLAGLQGGVPQEFPGMEDAYARAGARVAARVEALEAAATKRKVAAPDMVAKLMALRAEKKAKDAALLQQAASWPDKAGDTDSLDR